MRVRKMTALMLAGAMTASMGTFAFADEAKELPTIDSIKLGEDYTDLTASIKVLTHRTDIVDTTFQDYIKKFNESYPNITIEYEAVTDYAEDIKLRLTTDDWGDICGIPTNLQKNELEDEFISYGDKETLDENYVLLNNFAYNGNVYGIPSTGNAQGIVYNKKVFEEAGVTELPKTPTEFIEALQKIKDNTDAIPMYTNFAAGWTMGAWDAYIGGCATGDPDFMNYGMVHGENPFADNGDETGPFAVYNILYQAVSQELIEDDPTTTDWEGSKGMMNNGQIGCMVLGSWAIPQIQSAGEHSDDIAYMPFPITVNGKQYAAAGPDYCYGINVNSSEDEQIAAMCYIKWLLEDSGYAESEGGISVAKDAELPEALVSFKDVELIINDPAPEGEETLANDINNDSELGINVSGYIPKEIVEAATSGAPSMEEMVDEWNQKWTQAQENAGVTPQEYDYEK